MRYNTSLNTGNLDDNYRIVYYVGSYGPVTLVDNRTDTATYLYVDAFDDTKLGWTRVGTSPYLSASDYPINYISELTDNEKIGDFSFQNVTSYDGGEVFVEINATQLVPAGDTLETVELWLYNQTGSPFLAYTFEPKNGTWGWVTSYDVSSVLDTKARINGAQAYLVKRKQEINQTVYVDSMRIKIHNPGYVHEPATLTWSIMPEPRDGVWNWTDVNDIRFVVETKAASGTTDHGCRFHEFEAWVTVASPKPKLHVERVIDDSLVPTPPVTIKPNADRFQTWNIYPAAPTTHYDKVYDWPAHDSDATYVYTNVAGRKESFALEDPVAEAWEISSVRIVVYARQTTGNELLFGYLRISSVDYASAASYIPTTEYARYTFDYGLNPYTLAPWQWGQMAALVAGVISYANGAWSGELRVTQLYVEIFGSPKFDADVWVEGAVDVWGFTLIISYDTSVLSAVGYGNYTPFSMSLPSSIDDVIGYVAFGYNLPVGSGFGASGNVTCGKATFVADSEGFSTLDLSNTKLSNSKAAVIPHSVVNSMFENQVGAAPVEDVVVRTVTPSASVAYQGYPRDVSVDVKNEGTVSATFDVTAFYNGSSMGTQTVTSLAAGVNKTLTFTWNTAGVSYGDYTISAFATKLTYEVDTGDNSLSDGTVRVTIPGDVNGDRIVDGADFSLMGGAYRAEPGDSNWNANCDINGDNIVDGADFSVAGGNYRKEWP